SPGTNGGKSGSRQKQLRRTAQGDLQTIGGTDDAGNWLPQMLGGVQFKPGESFVFESGGGGGWGNPHEREAESGATEVRNELVTLETAESVDGVVLTPALEVDADATASLRSTLAG